MDIASLVLGIVSVVFSFFCGFVTMITAPIGIILGIVDLVKKKKENMPNKGMAITGIILGAIGLLILIVAFIFLVALGVNSGYYYY